MNRINFFKLPDYLLGILSEYSNAILVQNAEPVLESVVYSSNYCEECTNSYQIHNTFNYCHDCTNCHATHNPK